MIKKIFCIIVFLFCLSFTAKDAFADPWPKAPTLDATSGGDVLNTLTWNISQMAYEINVSSSQMMKLADMLRCNSLHGEAATVKLEVKGISIYSKKLIALDIFVSSIILYVLGFFIMMIASFYMFDIAFNLSIAIVLLPLGLALWPFAWTRSHLKKVVESILYYTGVFIFLPLGILISKSIIMTVINDAFSASSGGAFDFWSAFAEDKSDLIKDNLGIFTLPFLKVLVCYIVAIRLIPLMAGEFCEHFFGGSLIGSPISEKLSQAVSLVKSKTIDKVGKYATDVAKNQVGKKIEGMGNRKGNFAERFIAHYGKNMAKTKK